MRFLSAGALLLVIIGAVNWLLVGLARIDLVAQATGDRFGRTNALSSAVYIGVGLAGLGLVPLLIRRVSERGRDDEPSLTIAE